jgi:hypothetical protein
MVPNAWVLQRSQNLQRREADPLVQHLVVVRRDFAAAVR